MPFTPFTDLLADVVKHGEMNPEHGYNCACMDHAIGELKMQTTSVLPGVVYFPVSIVDLAKDPDRSPMRLDPGSWEKNMRAVMRVQHVLRAVTRDLGNY